MSVGRYLAIDNECNHFQLLASINIDYNVLKFSVSFMQFCDLSINFGVLIHLAIDVRLDNGTRGSRVNSCL